MNPIFTPDSVAIAYTFFTVVVLVVFHRLETHVDKVACAAFEAISKQKNDVRKRYFKAKYESLERVHGTIQKYAPIQYWFVACTPAVYFVCIAWYTNME